MCCPSFPSAEVIKVWGISPPLTHSGAMFLYCPGKGKFQLSYLWLPSRGRANCFLGILLASDGSPTTDIQMALIGNMVTMKVLNTDPSHSRAMYLGSSRGLGVMMASGGGTGRSGQHGPKEQHGSQTSTWVQVALQTMDNHMAFAW